MRPVVSVTKANLLGAVVLLAAGLAVFGNALGNDFIIDDRLLILGEARVHQPDLRTIFGREYWPGGDGNRVYRPLTLLSLAGNWALSHEPWTFRLTNLLVHVAAAFALFLIVRELTGRLWPGLVAGLLFVVHPVHTTPLNQVIDRADLAAAGGVLWATWLYARDGGARPVCWWRPLLGAGVFAAALLFKESALPLPAVLVVYELSRPDRRSGWWTRALRWGPAVGVVLAAYLVLRISVLGGMGRPPEAISLLDNIIAHPEHGLGEGDGPALARWGTPLAVVARAAALLLCPWPLSWDYSYAAIDLVRRWSDTRLWLGVATLAACAALLVVSWRRRRVAFLGVGFALVTYAVVSNTFMIIGAVFAERYLYLPSAGFCLALGVLLATGRSRTAARLRGGLAVLLVVAGAGLTVARNRDFASNAVLNARDVRTQPRSARLWTAFAADALNAGDYRAALERVAHATAITPADLRAWRVAARAHWSLRDDAAALEAIERAVAIAGLSDPAVVVIAGDIYSRRGEYGRAIAVLEAYVRGEGAEAGGAKPADDEARAARDLLPDAPAIYNNLAWYLLTAEPATLRDPARALGYATRAFELDPNAGDVLDTYTAALTALGRRDEARRALEERLPRLSRDDPQRAELERRWRDLR
jgi:tetratricopeptide (TPR) repeat protein